MGNVTKLKKLIDVVLILMPRTTPEILNRVIGMLDTITTLEKSEVWKRLGDGLLDEAESASISDVDSYFLLAVGSGCVGLSIGLKRVENQKASQA
ncbi:hypothetical protein CSQ91_06315 [Janthinobacterium sp. BJB301]|uniref:hypothetical protein n=1 Tax=Janthinobacterium sp. BJB301 TaxID=1560195 RepID=UPI000C0D63F7|nr:hypothetical protein [Janthinobacterium sp. BJB301]PHV50764.1 hypothetical protein CSQ91_06315 [Janthinobacterium sp. BJB301]